LLNKLNTPKHIIHNKENQSETPKNFDKPILNNSKQTHKNIQTKIDNQEQEIQ
ncbi:8348_t:CDS:1, partial [Racocetra fulgida]